MDVIQDRPPAAPTPSLDALGPLRLLLLDPRTGLAELPSAGDLAAAATALARGARHKALLPLAGVPIEFALVRRGARVLVSAYDTSSAPEVHQLDRDVSLADLLRVSARATLQQSQYETEPTNRQIAIRLAERALKTTIVDDRADALEPSTECRGATSAQAVRRQVWVNNTEKAAASVMP